MISRILFPIGCIGLAAAIGSAPVLAADCRTFKLDNGKVLRADIRSFVDKVICPGPPSSGCPNRPYVQGKYGEKNQPGNAIGDPEAAEKQQEGLRAYSLGCNSSATWSFDDNVLTDNPGDDLFIFELKVGAPEQATVEISEDGRNWIMAVTFAGGVSGLDIADKAAPGIAYRFVRLTDLGSSRWFVSHRVVEISR